MSPPPPPHQCHHNETVAFFYNNSNKTMYDDWTMGHKVVMVLGIGVCVFIMLANLLVMAAVRANRRFHFPIYYLMANLAAADFLAGAAYCYLMFNTGPNTRKLTVNTWMLRQGLMDTSLTASVANLLAIAIERHITVFRMQLHTRMSERRVVVVIALIWLVAILMGAIPSMGWNCLCDIGACSTMAPLYSVSYVIFWAVSNLSTFLIMVGLYGHIFVYVRSPPPPPPRHTSGARRNRETIMSLLKTVTIVLGAFIVCWTPGLVILLLDVFCPSCEILAYEKFFLLLAEFNSAMNPIIYSFRDKEMLSTFKRLLCCRRVDAAAAAAAAAGGGGLGAGGGISNGASDKGELSVSSSAVTNHSFVAPVNAAMHKEHSFV